MLSVLFGLEEVDLGDSVLAEGGGAGFAASTSSDFFSAFGVSALGASTIGVAGRGSSDSTLIFFLLLLRLKSRSQ